MIDPDAIYEQLTISLERLLVSKIPPDAAPHHQHYQEQWNAAVAHARSMLGARGESLASDLFELRLRVAMHLSPIDAIGYDATNPTPRHTLITDYLRAEFGRSDEGVPRLARDIASVLDRWDASRKRTSETADVLLRRQAGRCAHCGFVFDSWRSSRTDDVMKPYHESPEEFTSPEVDHIEAISGFGTNETRNLQVLCRLCNAGKGDGLGLDVRREAKRAADRIAEIPVADRVRMFYYVLERAERRCAKTGRDSTQCELTMRLVRPRGGFLRTNLQPEALDVAESTDLVKHTRLLHHPETRSSDGA